MTGRAERMGRDADRAEGKAFVEDPAEGLREHVQRHAARPVVVSRDDVFSGAVAFGSLDLDGLHAMLSQMIATEGATPLARTLTALLDILTITRQLGAAYHDDPTALRGLHDIQVEIARGVRFGPYAH